MVLHPQAERRQPPEAQPRLAAASSRPGRSRCRGAAGTAPHSCATPPIRSACPPTYLWPSGAPRRAEGHRVAQVRRRERVVDRREDARLAAEKGGRRGPARSWWSSRSSHRRRVGARQRLAHLVQVGRVDERRLDAVPRQDAPQDRDGAPDTPSPATTRDPFCVTVKNSEEIAAGPEAEPDRGLRLLQVGHRGLERIDRRVAVPRGTHSRARRSGSPARTRRSSRSGTSRTGRSACCWRAAPRRRPVGVRGALWNRRRFAGSLTTGSLLRPSRRIARLEVEDELRELVHHLPVSSRIGGDSSPDHVTSVGSPTDVQTDDQASATRARSSATPRGPQLAIGMVGTPVRSASRMAPVFPAIGKNRPPRRHGALG